MLVVRTPAFTTAWQQGHAAVSISAWQGHDAHTHPPAASQKQTLKERMPFARDLGSATPTEDLAGLVPALHFGGLWLKLRRGQSHAKEGWRFQQGPGRRRATCNVTLMIQCSRGFRLQEKLLSRKRDGVGEELDLSQSWTVGRRCAKIDTCAAGAKSMTHCWAGRRSLPERPGGQTSTQPYNSHNSPAASARAVAARPAKNPYCA